MDVKLNSLGPEVSETLKEAKVNGSVTRVGIDQSSFVWRVCSRVRHKGVS